MKWMRWMVVGFGMIGSVWAAPQAVPEAEQQQWIKHLLPLPHEIAIAKSVTLKPADIGIVIRNDAGPVQVQILADLTALFQERAGQMPTGTTFQIILGVLDEKGQVEGRAVADAAHLKSCPNSAQAYLIRPDGDTRLVVAALNEKGLYYGAQTLRQLLAAKLTRDSIIIPLAVVTDWPDMEERGVWNSPFEAIPWMAALKLNHQTYVCGQTPGTNQIPVPRIDRVKLDMLRQYAMVICARMLYHLNYFDKYYGLYKFYPELKGQGEKAVCAGELFKFAKRDIPVICASQPQWRIIVADMLKEMAAQGAREVTVWLSEFEGQCQCAECLKSTQVQLESKLVTEAWQEARKKYPDLMLRIFFSQGDASPATVQALADLPPEIKIERVYSIYKPFLDAAAQGRWVLSFSGAVIGNSDQRFKISEALVKPITNGYTAKLKGVLSLCGPYLGNGLIPPNYYPIVLDYPLSALAEWSWNVNGRTVRQFNAAWATRHGFNDPALFAEWTEVISALNPGMLGTPSKKDFKNQFRVTADKIKHRQSLSCFSTQELTIALGQCWSALAIAEKLNQLEPAVETRYFLACVQMQAKLAALSDLIVKSDVTQPSGRQQVKEAWDALRTAMDAVLAAKGRQIDLWKAKPADFTKKVQEEIRGQWLEIQKAMDEAIAGLLKTMPVNVMQ